MRTLLTFIHFAVALAHPQIPFPFFGQPQCQVGTQATVDSFSSDPDTNYFLCHKPNNGPADECVTQLACGAAGGVYYVDISPQEKSRTPGCYSPSFRISTTLQRTENLCAEWGMESVLCVGNVQTLYACSDLTISGPDCKAAADGNCCSAGHCDADWIALYDQSHPPEGEGRIKRFVR